MSEQIPVNLLKEGKINDWNKWRFQDSEQHLDLTNTDLSYLDLSGANLSGADLSGADLSGADLSNADLSGANLSGADLSNADLTDANIKGVIIDENTQINEGEFAFYQLVNDEIDIDSLSDEEAIKLHKQIAYYLLEKNFKVENDYNSQCILSDSRDNLKELWLRTLGKLDEKILFEGDYCEWIEYISDVFPYAYVAFYEGCSGDFEALQRLELSFLSRVIMFIVGVLWDTGEVDIHFGSYETEGLASQIAFLIPEIPNLKGVEQSDEQVYASDLLVVLSYVIGSIVTSLYISSYIVQEYNEYCCKDGKPWFQFILEIAKELFTDTNFQSVVCDLKSVERYDEEKMQYNSQTIDLLVYINSSNTNVKEVDFSNAYLKGVNLSGANLEGVNLSNANLEDANLTNVNLSGADLTDANLTDADLSDANLSGADLSGADLSGANLDENTKIDEKWQQVWDILNNRQNKRDLSGADLSGANLTDAYLTDAYLTDANLSGAYLTGAYLSEANLSGADLSDANLSDANLSGATLWDADLSGADLTYADLTDANLEGIITDENTKIEIPKKQPENTNTIDLKSEQSQEITKLTSEEIKIAEPNFNSTPEQILQVMNESSNLEAEKTQDKQDKPETEKKKTMKTNLNIDNLKVGDYLSETQYYQVEKINPKTVKLINERGLEHNFEKELIVEGMYSASLYEEEKTVNRTEVSEILQQAGSHIFTVNFHKQAKEKEIKEKLLDSIKDEEGNLLSSEEIEKRLKKISKELTKGEERTLIGYLFELNTNLGRSLVIDMEMLPEQNRIRQIDHRTINWLILKNTKYIVK